jgi:flagella basal body P-ring formation protein FlgA
MREKPRLAVVRASGVSHETKSASRDNNAVSQNDGSSFRSHRTASGRRANPIGLMALFGMALFGLCALSPGSALSASLSDVLPVPTITIHPGDAIKDDWLVDREFSAASPAGSSFVSSRETIVGKIARRTLLPGAPIPLNAVSTPKIVANGAKVRIVLEEGALTIATYGAALQDGGVGDVISLRNLETGLTVSGTIQADGSVRLSGG